MKLSTAISSFVFIYGASSASASEETASGVDKATYGGFEDHLKDETKSLRGLQAGEGTFIVTFADDNGDREAKAQGLAKAFGGSVKYVYDTVLNGAALTVPNAAAAAGLAHSPHVQSVEADGMVYASAGSWGLDRIDQCPTSRDGIESKANGSGVKVSALFCLYFNSAVSSCSTYLVPSTQDVHHRHWLARRPCRVHWQNRQRV